MPDKGKAKDIHLDSLISSAADHFVRDKIDTVHLVRMSGEIDADFISPEVPKLDEKVR